MFEHKSQPLLSGRAFALRLARHAAIAGAVVVGALAVGVLGYHGFGQLPWIDAVENAAMILGGMGPVDQLSSGAAKLFASGYALFSGVVFLAAAGLLLAPVFHRVLHHFHLDED